MLGLSLVVASGGHSSSRCTGLSLSRPLLLGAQAPDAQAQQLWLTGPAALRHVGSSQTRARTRVPCISRQILNHCATREAREIAFKEIMPMTVSETILKNAKSQIHDIMYLKEDKYKEISAEILLIVV